MIKIPARVLVVDDEKDFVEMFSLRLEELGHKVFAAYNGKEALEKLEEKQGSEGIDVIILDIRMPGMDGIETLKEIRKKYPVVETIMLTGHGTIETAVDAMKFGAFDYLMKPADFEEVKVKLESARKRKEEQMERIRKAEQRALIRRVGEAY